MLPAVVSCLWSVLLLWSSAAEARGAGRAFPVDSENYVIKSFTDINSALEWDSTNFLVDLAGYYVNCDSAGSRAHTVTVDTSKSDGDSISGVVDSIDGSRADVDAVNNYIKTVIDDWVNKGNYNSLIRGAQRFGCSVRPGCSGSVVVGCLFSPGEGFAPGDEQPDNILESDRQLAQAFTPEQYEVTETFTGNKWDRSHFLENLSGLETKCAMIGDDNWPFAEIRKFEIKYGIRINPVYGSSPNHGSTEDALEKILKTFKQIKNAKELGCSLISDCVDDSRSEMFVVVTCLYGD